MRSNASSVFKWVVDDVIAKVKPEFVQEGVEESVLDELRQTWETKLMERGLIAGSRDDPGAAGPGPSTSMGRHPMPGQPGFGAAPQGMGMIQQRTQAMNQHPLYQPGGPLHHLTPQLAQQMLHHMQQAANNRLVKPEPVPVAPVGIKRKEPEGGRGVPQHDGPADAAEQQPEQQRSPEQPEPSRAVPQHDGPEDGGAAAAGGAAAGKAAEVKAEEPAGDEVLSEDSEPEEEDEGEISNYLCCQFEKVTRVKNKWKISVRDGVFHMNGQDYLFKKATGEWSWT